MEGVVYPRSIGLDIHQKMIVCCFTAVQADRTIIKETAEFETFKRGLKALASWCRERVPDVVLMESTGIYWKAPYAYLERAGIVPAVVNARHIKNLEGKKTDMADAEWLAVVASAGMFCRSYVPKEAYRNMRVLSRHVLGVTRSRQQYKNRISKILADAGARLNVVFSDISGVNAQRCVKGLIAGMKPEDIAATLDYTHLKATREDIVAAMECELSPAHLATLDELVAIVDFLTEQIDKGRKTLLDIVAPEISTNLGWRVMPRRHASACLNSHNMEDCLVPKTSNFYAALQKRPRHRGPQRREGAQRSGSGEQDQARPSSCLEKRIHREGSRYI